MRMRDLAETVSKKQLPPWTKSLLVEVMVCDEEGEDVEVKSRASHWVRIVLQRPHRFRSLSSISESDIVVTCVLDAMFR